MLDDGGEGLLDESDIANKTTAPEGTLCCLARLLSPPLPPWICVPEPQLSRRLRPCRPRALPSALSVCARRRCVLHADLGIGGTLCSGKLHETQAGVQELLVRASGNGGARGFGSRGSENHRRRRHRGAGGTRSLLRMRQRKRKFETPSACGPRINDSLSLRSCARVSVCLSVRPSVCLSTPLALCVCLSLVSLCLSVSASVSVSLSLSLSLSASVYVFLSFCLYAYLCISFAIYTYIYVCTYTCMTTSDCLMQLVEAGGALPL